MIKKLYLGLFCLSCTLGVSTIQLAINNEVSSTDMAASSYDIYYDDRTSGNYLGDYFRANYSDFISYSEITSERKIVQNVRNYYQTYLNEYYNDVKDIYDSRDGASGTCSIVSCLEMVEYFGTSLGEFTINVDYRNAFVRIFDACLNQGYTTLNKGTSKSNEEDCLDISFSTYGSSRTANGNWWYLTNNIRDAANGNTPIMLSLTDHSVVVVGTTKYRVTYKKTYTTGWWWWEETVVETVNEDVEFAIVNDGWGSAAYSGLIPFSKITNRYDGMQVIWAEL